MQSTSKLEELKEVISKQNAERKLFHWLNTDSRKFLEGDYLVDGQSAEERYRYISETAERILGIEGFADKFYNYLGKGYYSLSTPILTNFGLERGYPISCYGSMVEDSIDGIFTTLHEVAMMNKTGGGTSAYFGKVRPRGSSISHENGKSNGTFSFLTAYDSTVNVVNQGSARRGMMAAYIDIDHGDIEEWLNIHTEGNPIQNIYYGVNVRNKWLEEMKAGDKYKRDIWAKLLKVKRQTGIPYINFIDNVNNNKPDVYRDKNIPIYASNLCNEISLPSSKDWSFVCCLMSMNLNFYNEWKDTDAVETAIYFLDAVMTEFINKADGYPGMHKAVRFAREHRALGLGVLGWHSYLQSEGVAFDSFRAMGINNEVFRNIRQKANIASAELAQRFGEPELLKGYGRRNTTLMALAPTKSSSYILGQVSPSIEPLRSNYFVKDVAKNKSVYVNPALKVLLQLHGQDKTEVWDDIAKHDGSVQHLTFLSADEKNVFKTFSEISQMTIIQQAAQRQVHIDQAQSINVMFHPQTPIKDINALYLTAAELGVKGIYYQYSISAAQEFNRELATQCTTCEA